MKRNLLENENCRHLCELQKLIQASLDGFWVASTKDARILEVNDAFCNMVGYSREELLSMCIPDLEANESPEEIATHIKKVMEVGHDRFETRHRHKQGRLVDFEVSVSHSELDGGVNFVFVRDITARKRTENALYFVAQRGWMNSAENFFDALAQYLGEALEVDYVIIDRLDKTPGFAETVALYAKGAIVPNMRYDLKGTPCENVMGRKFCFYPQGIQQLFPEDALLVEMGAESYAGLPLWNSAGQPIGLIAVMDSKPLADESGISKLLQLVAIRAAAELERERSDRLLREHERDFRNLAESSPDSIIRYGHDGRIRYLNSRLLGYLGLSAEDVIGKLPSEVWPDGRYAQIERANVRAMETREESIIEFSEADATGVSHFNQVHVVPERNAAGQIIGTLAIGRDITIIREAECQLNHFIANLPGMAYTFRLSPDGHACFPYASPAIEEFYGLKLEDVKNDIAPLHALVHPDDLPHIKAAIAESARTMTLFRLEFRACRKDLPVRWFEARSLPEREADGSILWYGLLLDITERKQSEKTLQIMGQERISHLERLEEASRRLVAAQEEARRRLSAELHDRTSPNLAAIAVNLDMLATELSQCHLTEVIERLEDTRALIEDTAASIREICADLRPPLLDYAGLCAALEGYARQFSRRTGIKVQLECANRDIRLTPDLESLLFRIFQEALTNCAKHAHATSVMVTLDYTNCPIVLTIADNGVGFAAALLGKTVRSGLGLINMREMAEVAGGRFTIESMPGKGTRICVVVNNHDA